MNEGESNIKRGQVESIDDTADALRIKIRIEADGNRPLSEIPYAFPLMPKFFQSVPKIGEGALVMLSMTGNRDSQRYYLGPIVSQPQFNENCNYNYGRGQATTVLEGGVLTPMERISNFEETNGSFPDTNDIAVVGRGSQDIIMKTNDEKQTDEIDIRCGIRKKQEAVNDSRITPRDLSIAGKRVFFNNSDPAYIQLKYKTNLTNGADINGNSAINLVADKINIISNKDENSFELTDNKELIPTEKISEMMEKLHQLPHGDTLVELLKLIVMAILTHVHPQAGMMVSVADYVKEMQDYDIEKILSKHVRIS